ncbi:MAG: hypothetical protein KBG00_10595 [Rhodoferax sp.]|uniref:hypothetical protein n=1 Tax=Rhodoferax sp. TaxID=50421 RepID=UPI001B40D7E7|nr:hypothetical protein [Rhodoferax sp.]MBP9149217.1 hypothetical protein [Rhodoferax sp.]MBP9736168.1 hypothetical protein [Rhodoferax sp.]
MNDRTAFEASIDKRAELNRAEASGEIADSMTVRLELMEKVRAGVITLKQAQDQLKKIQRTAAANGKVTRAQAFNRG